MAYHLRLIRHLCGRSGQRYFQTQLLGNRLLDDGALEKPGLLRMCSMTALVNVNSRKFCAGDGAPLNHLKRFG